MEHPTKEIKEQFVRQLKDFLADRNEKVLEGIYELGRQSVEMGIGELEILSLYQQAFLQLKGCRLDEKQEKQLSSNLQFLSECLAPYQIRQQGFGDLIRELHDQNEKLQKEIEQRKKIEEELVRSKEYFQQLIYNALDIITVINCDGIIQYGSPSVVRILGYKPSKMEGKKVMDYIHPEDQAEFRRQFFGVAQNGGPPISTEFRFRHRDGTWRYLESNAKRAGRIGSDPAVIVNSRDVTERVQVLKKLLRAHEKLKENRQQLIAAQEIARLGSWEWDIQTGSLQWSDQLCKIYGLPQEESPEEYEDYLALICPEDRKRVDHLIQEAFEKQVSFEFEHRILQPDGSRRDLHCRGEVIFDREGLPSKMVGTGQDITRIKAVEKKLRAYSDQLRKLSAKQNKIREEERIRIAREIHDELGQMLTVLKMDIGVVMKRAAKVSGEEVMNTFERGMKDFAGRIDTIISSVQRITAELRPEVLDDLGLIEAIEWQASEFRKRTGIEFRFIRDIENVDGLDDDRSTAIFRIFQETLTNILRHAEATAVDITLAREDNQIQLTVKDNGKGIDEEKINHSSSLGIIGMRERSQFLGGNITFSGNESGTIVTLVIPVE